MKRGSISAMLLAASLFATLPVAAQTDTPVAPVVPQWMSQQGADAYRRGDYLTAYRLLKPVADQGNAWAQFMLGHIYLNGQGVPQDYAAAASWFRKAADQGNTYAQGILGYMYVNGQGVPQDYVQAHKWYNLSAARSSDAEAREGSAKSRDIVATQMTSAQIAEAQRLASAWEAK